MDLSQLRSWLNTIDKKTLKRGEDYYDENRVGNIEINNNLFAAFIEGSGSNFYAAGFLVKKNGVQGECTCPVSYGCKHLVALAMELLNKEVPKENPTVKNPQINLSSVEKGWLNKLKKEEKIAPCMESSDTLVYSLICTKSTLTLTSMIEIYRLSQKNDKGFKLSQPISLLGHGAYDFYQNTNSLDQEIITELFKSRHFPVDEISFFKKLISLKKLFWKTPKEGLELKWAESKLGSFEWKFNAKQSLIPKILIGGVEKPFFITDKNCFYVDAHSYEIGVIEFPISAEKVKMVMEAPPIHYSKVDLMKEELMKVAPHLPVLKIDVIKVPEVDPIPYLQVSLLENSYPPAVHGVLSFQYGDRRVRSKFGSETLEIVQEKNSIYHISRNQTLEKEAIELLLENKWMHKYSVKEDYYLDIPQGKNPATIFVLAVNTLRLAGWKIEGSNALLNKKVVVDPEWYGEVSESENNWFDLEIGSVIDGKRVNLIDGLSTIMEQLKNKGIDFEDEKNAVERFVITTKDGDYLILPFQRMKALFKVFFDLINYEKKDGKISFSHASVPSLSSLDDENCKLTWQMPQSYVEIRNKFKEFSQIEKATPPKELACDLRPYQIEGLSWMQFLARMGLGGILADDMGLGKTVQTLAHILLEKKSGRMTNPALIVAPTSLMGNWLLETKKFASELSVLILQGLDRKNYFEEIQKHDIVLTTYPLLVRDEKILVEEEFHFLILDEAQMIKNAKTKAHQVLRAIQAKHRLCLTGTPMENHLGELWALFHVILPGFLGTEKQFQSLFRKPIEKEGSLERKALLQKRINPFLLRRTKEEVTPELPQKSEIIVPIELTEAQKDLYEAVRLTMMKKVLDHVESKGFMRSRIVLLDALLKLRQICCDPRLLKSAIKSVEKNSSSKLAYLVEILPQMIKEKRQILLFSQFTSLLSLIEEELMLLRIPYVILTGDTKDRITPIEEFQSGRVPLFLISLKAGGTGLNLTAADTVIHYDPWWNPAVENQATARAHRIGQTKPVFVYKWISSGSIEEKILELQKKKKALVDGLFEEKEDQFIEMTKEDIETLFAPLSTFVQV